jgi:hypothetical protein
MPQRASPSISWPLHGTGDSCGVWHVQARAKKPVNCLKELCGSVVCSLVNANKTKGHIMKSKPLRHTPQRASQTRAAGELASLFAALALAAWSTISLNAVVLDDFSDGVLTGWSTTEYLPGVLTLSATNGLFLVEGDFEGKPFNPSQLSDHHVAAYQPVGGRPSLPGGVFDIREGQTLEFRVDLVRVNQRDVGAELGWQRAGGVDGYTLHVLSGGVVLVKWSPVAMPYYEPIAIKNTNVVLVLALTGSGNDVIINARILDKDRNRAVLFDRTVVDTPGKEPVAQGLPYGLVSAPDWSWTERWSAGQLVYLGLKHFTDGTRPPAQVVFDNLEYDIYDAPVLDIEKSVLLSWPQNTAEEQIVLGATTANGPWVPWLEPIFKRQGTVCMAVPITFGEQWLTPEQFFKLGPGTQFSDDFNVAQSPYASKGAWVPYFWNVADSARYVVTVTNENNTLRVQAIAVPLDGRVIVAPPGPDVVVGDFCASVDILDWDGNVTDESFAIYARGWRDDPFPGQSNTYIGGLLRNPPGRARLLLYTGASPDPGGAVIQSRSGRRLPAAVLGGGQSVVRPTGESHRQAGTRSGAAKDRFDLQSRLRRLLDSSEESFLFCHRGQLHGEWDEAMSRRAVQPQTTTSLA